MSNLYGNFQIAQKSLFKKLIRSPRIHTERWQGFDVTKKPEAAMVELLFENFRVPLLSEDLEVYRKDIPANYPWADDHFYERIAGVPMNPGTEWANWPWGNSAANSLDEKGQFNHNYMERYWPNHAGYVDKPTRTASEWCEEFQKLGWQEPKGPEMHLPSSRKGIRGSVGNLGDLIEHLCEEHTTRQAYYPIFFPEDVKVRGRKPCTLGYHFIMRHDHLHVVYYMRSCDFYRHWADDCYLTVRLLLWVLGKCRQVRPEIWNHVKPGFFKMDITSLHMFVNDAESLKDKIDV